MMKQMIYTCTNCDAQSPKWSGRCLQCQAWGTIVEEQSAGTGKKKRTGQTPIPLSEIAKEKKPRIKTGIGEIDNVLGGGIVAGSLTLLGGEPGIGKSTLALQIMEKLAAHGKPLYISGEESGQQIHLRAERLSIQTDNILFSAETSVEGIAAEIAASKPPLVIVDSIQTIYSEEVPSEPGNIAQVRACTVKLLSAAKTSNVPILLIGHVTKEGAVAGPKTLEHLVDTVLYLEGDRYHRFRLLRTVKNRFGATNEVGVFEMTSLGLAPVENPSSLFVSSTEQLPGSAITCIFEGSRPFLIEIQALVTKSPYPSPQRRASGYDLNRLQLLLAVLEKRTELSFHQLDVHVNVVGGMKIKDPSTDLAVSAAIMSAAKEAALPAQTLLVGEMGLAGEIRPVRNLEDRLKEGAKLGYKNAFVPVQKVKSTLQKTELASISELEAAAF